MKAIIYSLALALVLASCLTSKAQISYPPYEFGSINPFSLFQERTEERRTIRRAGMLLSGYSFHPIYCDSQIIESYDQSAQAFRAETATKMSYDNLMRPILRKTYRNLATQAHDTLAVRISYDTQDRIIEMRLNDNLLASLSYNAFNDLFLSQEFSRSNQQWVERYSDSVAITYENGKPVSRVHYTRDISSPVYYAHFRNLNIAFDSNNHIKHHLRQQIEWPNLNWPNHFYSERNLEWQMGYPTNHMEFDNRPNYRGYLIALPHNWYAQIPEPTKGEYYRVDGLVFSLGQRLLNDGWQNNKLKITEEYRVHTTGAIDTSHQRQYERDQWGRLIYYQVDSKTMISNNLRIWPELAYRWTYDLDDRLLSTTLFENMSPLGHWLDSTVIERTYEFTSDLVPRIFRFTDSLTANGIKRPFLRHTYHYGNFALSNPVLSTNQNTHLYPNPTSESFFIEGITSLGQKSTIGVYTALGQLIWQQSLNIAEGDKQEIKLSAIPPGIYHVVLHGSLGQSSHRLIIR